MKRKTINVLFLISMICFLLIGIYICAGILSTIILPTMESSNWPQTQGVITKSEIRTTTLNRYKNTHTPDIVYHYTVNNQQYNGTKISYNTFSSTDYLKIQNIIAIYPVGKNVSVYYNPTNPSVAVLERGLDINDYVPLYLGSFFSIVGVLGLIVSIRKYRKSKIEK